MLGRGLESLIPNKQPEKQSQEQPEKQPLNTVSQPINIPPVAAPPHPPAVSSGGLTRKSPIKKEEREAVFQIEVDKIEPNPHQPRRAFDEQKLGELAASIRELGVIQPLIVLKRETETAEGTAVRYQIVAGERRWRAAKMAGLERVPAIIRRVGQEKEKLEMAIVENIQRTDLNPIEAARSYAKLQEEFGMTQREVAARVGKSRETISNIMRLLNLPSHIQEAIAKGKISDSQGRLLLAVSDISRQGQLFEEIIKNNLSVRELRSKVERIKRPEKSEKTAAIAARSPELEFAEERLRELFGTKVALQGSGVNGKIVISFFSPEELREIIKKIALSDSIQNDTQLS